MLTKSKADRDCESRSDWSETGARKRSEIALADGESEAALHKLLSLCPVMGPPRHSTGTAQNSRLKMTATISAKSAGYWQAVTTR
jgi:hypothetical protein